jgi:hypothetical protein
MRYLFMICLIGCSLCALSQTGTPPAVKPTLKSVLLEQLRTTWNKQDDWYVPVMKAVEGLTPQQAAWRPTDSTHSVGELTYHIWFWNTVGLDKFYGRKRPAFSGNNNDTFTGFKEANWTTLVQQLDQVMKDWEQAIIQADEPTLEKWYKTIADMSTHNTYHTGQILVIRKLANNWDSNKGVK